MSTLMGINSDMNKWWIKELCINIHFISKSHCKWFHYILYKSILSDVFMYRHTFMQHPILLCRCVKCIRSTFIKYICLCHDHKYTVNDHIFMAQHHIHRDYVFIWSSKREMFLRFNYRYKYLIYCHISHFV